MVILIKSVLLAALLPPQKSVSAPTTPRSNRGLSPRPHSGGQRWADDSNSFKYQVKISHN
jgi:hypothetical protein